MDETHEGRFSGQQNQNQGPPSDHIQPLSGGMTARERRYMRERRRARTHRSLLDISGAGDVRIAALRSLIGETVTLQVEHSWRVLFPDDEEADTEEVVSVDVEAIENLDAAQDADSAEW